MTDDNLKMITIYHESPKFSNPNNLRMSACVVLERPIKLEGDINTSLLEPTKCIVMRFEIKPDHFQDAWEASFVWMTENGSRKTEAPPFEVYYNNASEHPEGNFIVDFCIPIV